MGTASNIIASGLSDVGLRRSSNEDSFLVHDEGSCFLVADGMGGAAAGEIASRIFTETAARCLLQQGDGSETDSVSLVKAVFQTANAQIREHIRSTPEHKGMGCTAELLLFHDAGFVLGHIGDSRTYRMRQGQFVRLTRDHSLVQDQVDQGLISREEAKTHRLRNVISRAVGVKDELEVDIVRGRYLPGDLFLLCSDGLTDMVSEEFIAHILQNEEPLITRNKQLIERAKSGGGRDNVTVVLVEVMI